MKIRFRSGVGIAVTAVLLLSLTMMVFFIRSTFRQKEEEYGKTVKEMMMVANYTETVIRFQKMRPGAAGNTGMQMSPVSGIGESGGRKPVMYLYKRVVPDAKAQKNGKGDDFDKIFNGSKSSQEDIQTSLTAGINAALKGLVDIDFNVFDSLLVAKLKDKGIQTPYRLELNYRDSAALNKVTGTPGFTESRICSFRHELPLDGENKAVYIYTSTPLRHIYDSISGVVHLSLLALVIILVSLFYLGHLILTLRRTRKMQDEFTHLVSHNMSNPIAIALASTESLQKKMEGNQEDSRQYLSIITRQLSKLDEQVKSILKPYRIASPQTEFLKQHINVAQEIKGILDQTGVAHPEVRFDMEVPADVTISANSSMFYEMMTNLVQNAVKYSPTDPHVTVCLDEGAGKKFLSVKDNGKGIEPEKLRHIFDKYYKTEVLSSTPGYGLGLYYVSQVVQRHGWDIRVESTPGKGSVFTVIIPE